MEIIVFALLAGYLFYRLWSILGSKTGHEKQRFEFYQTHEMEDDDNLVILPPRQMANVSLEEPISPEIEQKIRTIESLDSPFKHDRFVMAAEKILKKVIIAFSEGDLNTLKKFVSKGVYKIYADSIKQRETNKQRREASVENVFGKIIDIDISKKSVASIQVEFTSEQCINTLEEDGTSYDNPSRLTVKICDTWTFTRDLTSQDPIWYVSATTSRTA